MNWKSLIVPVIIFVVGGTLGFALRPIPPVPVPPLPDKEIVEVQVVKEIPVPGPERVVERVQWKTREVPVEKEVLREIQKSVETGSLEARVQIDADKYEGTNDDGDVVHGWFGFARCEARADQDSVWAVLVDEPFQLESSYAVSTYAPPIRDVLARYRFTGGIGLSTTGGVGMVGLEKRLPQPSNRFLAAMKPDWAGVQGFATPRDSGILTTVSWEF